MASSENVPIDGTSRDPVWDQEDDVRAAINQALTSYQIADRAGKISKEPLRAYDDFIEVLRANRALIRGSKAALCPEDIERLSGAPVVAANILLPAIDESVEYVIEPLAVKSCLTQLHGEPKSGKSCFALELAVAASLGVCPESEVISVPTAIPVLYLAYEDGPRRLKRRVLDYVAGHGLETIPTHLHLWVKPELDVCHPKSAELLSLAISTTQAQLVVVDTLSYVHRAESENDAGAMKEVMGTLTKIARTQKCAILYVHHASKPSENSRSVVYRGRGSSAIAAAADIILDWGRPDENNVTKCEFTSKDDEGQKWKVHYIKIDEGIRWKIESDVEDRPGAASESAVAQAFASLAQAHPNGCSASIIAGSLNIRKKTVQRALDRMLADNRVHAAGKAGRGGAILYKLGQCLS